MQFNESFIKQAVPDSIVLQYVLVGDDFNVSIDSRTIEPGDVFFPLKGSCFDGHAFIQKAFEQGALGCFVAADKQFWLQDIPQALLKDKLIVIVQDVRAALLNCAYHWRRQFFYPVIGITGSVGKTSTKEMIARVLDLQGLHYIASRDNQNTLLSAAVTIFRMRADHQVAIFEMGISERGEMEQLASLINPTIGLITEIGHQHMNTIGSLHDIAVEKRTIFKFFAQDSIGVINGDQPLLRNVSYQHPVIKCGTKMTNQIQIRKVKIIDAKLHFVLKIYSNKYSLVVNRPHAGLLWHALFAAAVARLLHSPYAVLIEAVQKPLIVEGRFEERQLKGNKGFIINDAYNANPESMKAALLAFQNMKTPQLKIAVLGDMLGLGVNSPFWHRQIGRFLRKTPSIGKLILVGDLVSWIKKTVPFSMPVVSVVDWKEAVAMLEEDLEKGPHILVKGSRDIGLEKLVEKLV